MKRYRLPKNRIAYRAAAWICLLILLPLVLSGIISAYYSSLMLTEQVFKYRENTIYQLKRNISSIMTNLYSMINSFDFNASTWLLLSRPYTASPDEYLGIMSLQRSIAQAYNADLMFTDAMDVSVWGKNGVGINRELIDYSIDYSTFSSNEWHSVLMRNPRKVVCFSGTLDDPAAAKFTMLMLLVAPVTGEECGVVIVTVDGAIIDSLYEDMDTAGGIIEITDSNGTIFSSCNKERIGSKGADLSQASQNHLEYDGIRYNVQHERIIPSDFTVYELTPVSELTKYSKANTRLIILIAVICGVISVLAVMLFLKRLTRPLLDLLNRLEGKRNISQRYTKRNELSVLSMEYDKLVSDLGKTSDELVEVEKEKRLAEFRTLQAQISSHFIYNTLSSIKCLIWTGEYHKIEQVVDLLSNILENSLSVKQEFFTLRKNIEIIKKYIALQEIRLCRQIELDIHCEDESCLDVPIPKLLLQPIVENAIFHGIEPLSSDGKIVLDISVLSKKSIFINICDNGIGISDEAAKNVFNPDAASSEVNVGENASANIREHIGLKNVWERIRLYYGDLGKFSICRKPEGGTAVTVVLPMM